MTPDSCLLTPATQPATQPSKLTIERADALTIEETIGTVFWQQMEGRPWNLYARANPEARQPIYRVLKNASLKAYYPAVWHILGYIGDDATVQLLEERLIPPPASWLPARLSGAN